MTQKKQIEQYRGSLSPEKIAEGMNAAARNAKRLFDDATMLLSAKKMPSACALAILSIEEAGKASLLRAITAAPNDAHLKQAWREYRDHKAKNVAWIIGELAAKGAKTLNDLKPIFDPQNDHPAVLDAVKQIALYTDCYGKGHWSEPIQVIDEKLAEMIVSIAKILLPKHETTTREIELWIEHVGKHWGAPKMYQGAIEFHKAMEKEGLSHHSIEEIEAFFDTRAIKSTSN